MEAFFVDGGSFDNICDDEYQITCARWKESVKHIVPEGAKHLSVNTGACTVSFWSDARNLKTIKVVGITLEDGAELKLD